MTKAWKIKENGHFDDIARLAQELNIDNILATLLIQRGINTFSKAKAFFRPELSNLYDPFLMNDMEKAVERLHSAISNQEKILVYCACWLDCDSDKDVEVRVGSDDGYKLWIAGKFIAEQNVYRAMEMDQETYKVKLNKGKNLLMIKVDQDTGEFQFMLRVVGADGKAAPGVTVWN